MSDTNSAPGETAAEQDTQQTRRKFLTAATSAVGVAGVVGVAVPFMGSWNPSEKAKAAGAPVKADISKLEPGQMVVVEWRGKPGLRIASERGSGSRSHQARWRFDGSCFYSVRPARLRGASGSVDSPRVIRGSGIVPRTSAVRPKFRPEVGARRLGG